MNVQSAHGSEACDKDVGSRVRGGMRDGRWTMFDYFAREAEGISRLYVCSWQFAGGAATLVRCP